MGKSFTDPAYGDTVTVDEEARNVLALPKGASRELVALLVTIHAGQNHRSGVIQGSLTIDADGSTAGNGTTQTYDSVASAAGLVPLLPAGAPAAGQVSRGWTVFTVMPGSAKSLTLLYRRAPVIVGGKHFPATSIEVRLPA